MAVRLIQQGQKDHYAATAVALAVAVARAGGQAVQSLPFGYEGPPVEHEGWLRREDLTRWLTQLGILVAGERFNALLAQSAIDSAIQECWLRVEKFDEWRPGMASGSGWTEVIQPQAAGIARAAQMAAETAASVVRAGEMSGSLDDTKPEVQAGSKGAPSRPEVKPKRSTEKGEGRVKLIAAPDKAPQVRGR